MDRYAGLTEKEAQERIAQGKGNVMEETGTRTVKQIVMANVFTLFNLINLVLFLLVLSVFSIKNAAFMMVVLINTGIGIFQEIRAKKTLDRLRILAVQKVRVIRDGKSREIPVTDLVEDDLMVLHPGDQIPADGEILSGTMEVNEALLTGESDPIEKKEGAKVLSGSFVTSGSAGCKVTGVGKDCYMEQIARKARVYQKHRSGLRDSVDKILKGISVIIVPLALAMFAKQYFLWNMGYKQSILDMVAAAVGMIPEGLVLLTSVALALGVIRLAKKRTLVQELNCIETLARVDTLCLDKTGTLTKGELAVEEILYGKQADPGTVDAALARMMEELSDQNETAKAVRSWLEKKQGIKAALPGQVLHKIPFSSERKYSGVAIRGQGTWYMGAYGFLFGKAQDEEIEGEIQKAALKGFRVLTVAHSRDILSKEEAPANLETAALLIIGDVIRGEAPGILSYFKEQDVDIRIISGDDPETVRAVAVRAGMDPASQAVDVSLLKSEEELRQALQQAKIFGRVMPGQKAQMVELLQEQGHTVAMTGDGVNDVLALKKADCSIAMASGSDAAKNVSNVVLLDSDFSVMPEIVKEGRRVINNIKRASSMFLIKTIFSVVLAVMTIFFGRSYPFIPVQLSLISAFAVGIPSFLLQFEPSFDRIQEGFLGEVTKNAVPVALTISTMVFLMQNIGIYVGFSEAELSTACILITGFNYVLAQTRVYSPMTTYRGVIVYSMQTAFLIAVMFLGRKFLEMTDLPLEIVAVILIGVHFTPFLQRFYDLVYRKLLAGFERHKKNAKTA